LAEATFVPPPRAEVPISLATQDDMKHWADRVTFFRRLISVNLMQEIIGKNLSMDELGGTVYAEAKNVACAVDPARSGTRHYVNPFEVSAPVTFGKCEIADLTAPLVLLL
jgi:hypothetical protein